MNLSPAVSVALCTHNGARFIEAQLLSIFGQTLLPQEIVLSDDASRDDTVERALQLHRKWQDEQGAAAATQLTVLSNAIALGVAGNFEQALRGCNGEFIALCDQDDVWSPDKLAQQVGAMQSRPGLLLLHSDARLVDAHLQPTGAMLLQSLSATSEEIRAVHQGRAFEVLLRRNLVTGAATIIRRSLLDQALPIPIGWLHDEWLGMVAAALDGVDLIEQPLIDYRQHGGNQVGAARLGLAAKVRKALKPRGDDPQRRRQKAELLVRRLVALGDRIPATRLVLAREKLAHHQCRAALPANRLLRCWPVLRELVTGRYARYDYGVQAVLRDTLEQG